MNTSFWTSEALSAAIIVVAALFAVIMSARATHVDKFNFITFLLQGVTIGAALVLVASLFYRPLFERLIDQKEFVLIVSLMTLIYAIRDVVGTVERSRTSAGENEKAK